MNSLNEEIERIKTECAEIGSKVFTGKSIAEQVMEMFSTITEEEYQAMDIVWKDLLKRRRKLQRELNEVDLQLEIVSDMICRKYEIKG